MTLEAVVFDLGGVLVRTEDPTPREQLAQRLGLTRAELERAVFDSPEGQAAQRGELDPEALWAHLAARWGLDEAARREAERLFWAGDRVDYALVERLRRLRPRYRVGLLSNAWRSLRPTLHRWGIADAFDLIVISAEEGVMKPDPAIYRRLSERLGVPPEHTLFVDDFPQNVAAAQALGFQARQFRDRAEVAAWLDALAAGQPLPPEENLD